MATILVIDDEIGVRLTLKAMLEGDGHTVLLAENGLEGLDMFNSNLADLDIVITDIMMPGLNGIEFLEKAREKKERLPVVAISGGGNRLDEEDPLHAATELASAILKKPFNSEELNRVLGPFINT
jgi:CheY-like chemotaxis protein